jgi:RNA ligase
MENKQYLKELINNGYLAQKYSDDGKLVLYNYTNKCIYDKKWNKITLNNRGHVYDAKTGHLIAVAFPKFFNLSELPTSKSRNLVKKKDYRCYEKLDGSLGIIYHYEGRWRVNTRGSFNSEQAKEAFDMLRNYNLKIPIFFTLLVEIIYPENRIVIDYKNKRELVLLSVYNRITGKELSRKEIEIISHNTGIPIVKEYDLTFEEMFEFQKQKNITIEGFVVRFKNGERVKIKNIEYLKIARLIAGLTPLNLWKTMKDGKVSLEGLELIPEEFRKEAGIITKELEGNYDNLRKEIEVEFEEIVSNHLTRKDIGLHKTLKHKGALFSMLDMKLENVDKYITKHIRP